MRLAAVFKHSLAITLPIALLGGTVSAWATVGGDDSIEVLGYEPVDNKVYLLKAYGDASESAALYYFDLKGRTPNKAIEAKSLYAGYGDGVSATGQMNNPGFHRKINAIKNRLKPMQQAGTKNATVDIISLKTSTTSGGECNYDGRCTQYHYQYRVRNGNYQIAVQSLTAYNPELEVSQAYITPKHNKMVATVKYTNTLWEGGYTTEAPVLLSPR